VYIDKSLRCFLGHGSSIFNELQPDIGCATRA